MRATIDFLLHDWLRVDSLFERRRFADHSRETVAAVLDSCERIARDKFAPINRTLDVEEPRLEGDRVVLPECLGDASQAYVDSGMYAASQDYEIGGMQLPRVVEAAANCFFSKASVGASGGQLLTTSNANLIMTYGTAVQKKVFAHNELAGRWFGTMCLSESQAGSSLADIVTRADPDGEGFEQDPLGPRYRLRGNKMWISNGDHELTDNIVHLVLAKIPGPDGKPVGGTRGISLFIVPKWLVDPEARLIGVRNDVAVAGLNHKLGWRGTPNTLLNFGEGRYAVHGKPGAIGYLIGTQGEGLKCMFHMMNEARIAVGIAATMIGYAGYEASFAYARDRRQGRPVGRSAKDPGLPPVRLIEHADVRRMLLAQKAYVEGALALELDCARCVDEQRTGSPESAAKAHLLLEILTLIAKSWPSEWCLEANSLAIQIHGGYGYTRDFPVEQYWRDNRLNMIHEGTHGIQGIDLLGRKVNMENGQALKLLIGEIEETVRRAHGTSLRAQAEAVSAALGELSAATASALDGGVSERALANATLYLQAFGHVVLAWQWLSISLTALELKDCGASASTAAFLDGKLQAGRFFHDFELPKIGPWLSVVASRNSVCLDAQEDWF